jgi:hypothetical protein
MIKIQKWKIEILDIIKNKLNKKNKKLIFIHIPKCGGSYISQYLNDLDIINNGHRISNSNNTLTFAVIRNPINRFESLLNYRLSFPHPRIDWPERLINFHYDKNKTLDDIVNNMTDEELVSFNPYKSLKYWTQNIKLLITIDEFIPILEYLGYKVNKQYCNINISEKNRGTLSIDNQNRIKKIYKDDFIIFEEWTRLDS